MCRSMSSNSIMAQMSAHNVYHSIIIESFRTAIRDQKIFALLGNHKSRPKKTKPRIMTTITITTMITTITMITSMTTRARTDGTKDFTYVATVDVVPEIEAKGYTDRTQPLSDRAHGCRV